jgi:hypothetical protein
MHTLHGTAGLLYQTGRTTDIDYYGRRPYHARWRPSESWHRPVTVGHTHQRVDTSICSGAPSGQIHWPDRAGAFRCFARAAERIGLPSLQPAGVSAPAIQIFPSASGFADWPEQRYPQLDVGSHYRRALWPLATLLPFAASVAFPGLWRLASLCCFAGLGRFEADLQMALNKPQVHVARETAAQQTVSIC